MAPEVIWDPQPIGRTRGGTDRVVRPAARWIVSYDTKGRTRTSRDRAVVIASRTGDFGSEPVEDPIDPCGVDPRASFDKARACMAAPWVTRVAVFRQRDTSGIAPSPPATGAHR